MFNSLICIADDEWIVSHVLTTVSQLKDKFKIVDQNLK